MKKEYVLEVMEQELAYDMEQLKICITEGYIYNTEHYKGSCLGILSCMEALGLITNHEWNKRTNEIIEMELNIKGVK